MGDPLEISGINYCPDEDVDLTIAGHHVGTAHTDSAGSFDPQVTTPGPPGPKQVCGIGASGLRHDRDCLFIHVQGAAAAARHRRPRRAAAAPRSPACRSRCSACSHSCWSSAAWS